MTSSPPPKPAKPRRRRFKRDANPPPMRLTQDDVTIIRNVAKHRFLRSTHIVRLMAPRSSKKIVERLGILYHNHYLDRPRVQLDYYATAGSQPMVHALGNRGAQILAERDGLDMGKIDWTWKNRNAGRPFIKHTLLTADLMIAAKLAVRARSDIELIETADILATAPEKTQRSKNPLKMTARVQDKGKAIDIAIIPDQFFGLDFTDDKLRKYFFVEIDCATMPIRRSNLKTSSIYRKWRGYVAGGGKKNDFGKQFDIGNFRVLTVTTSQARIANMIDALKHLTKGRGSKQFLFTDQSTLQVTHDVLSLEWITSSGESVCLTD